jgi:LPS export ABC transporter protein LptC
VIASDRGGRPAWHYWVAGAAVFVVGGYLYLFISAILAPPLPPITNADTVIMRALRVVGEHGAKLGWSFTADSSETAVDGGFTTYHNVHDGTYFEHGKPAYHISAKQIVLDTRSQNYSATGSVHIWAVTGAQPRDIRSESMMWNQPLQTLSCPEQVTVHYTGSQFTGTDVYINFRDGSIHTGQSAMTYHKKKT